MWETKRRLVEMPFQTLGTLRKHLKVLIYGQWGSGKTYLALGLPKPLLIDGEGGADMLAETYPEALIHKTRSWKGLRTALREAEPLIRSGEIQTIIVDPYTLFWEQLQLARQEVLDRNRAIDRTVEASDFQFKDWNILKRQANDFLVSVVNLPVNVILIARAGEEYREEKDGAKTRLVKTGRDKPSLNKEAPYYVDFVFECRITPNGSRMVVVHKARGAALPREIPNPDYTPPNSWFRENLSFLLDRAPGRGEQEAQLQGEEEAIEETMEATSPLAGIQNLAESKGVAVDDLDVMMRAFRQVPLLVATEQQIQAMAEFLRQTEPEDIRRQLDRARGIVGGSAGAPEAPADPQGAPADA